MKPGLPLSNRGRWLLAAVMLGALVILGVGLQLSWWPAASPIEVQLTDIASIQLQPVPEGPTLLWNNPPTSPYSEQRSQIEAAIPDPLPAPDFQPPGCSGGDLIVHLRDGRDITYGPCRHPASIRALWSRLIKVLSDPNCREPCGPTE
jgi:hypothetical protein